MILIDSITRRRPRLSRREDLLTVAFGAWLIIGLFVDGWAHSNDKPETFFTPWHAMFYSGFVATATWMCSRIVRHEGVPVGYGLGLVGVGIFALGGIGDLAWHEIFGIEVDIEAVFSPSHLVLFASAVMILTSPLRSAWSGPSSREPSLRQLLPALLSVTLATATVAFFFQPFSPFLSSVATEEPYRFLASNPQLALGEWLAEELRLEGLASVLMTTVILVVPALLLLRRWPRLPFGSLTLLFGTVVGLVAGIEGYDMGETVLAGFAGGLAGDLLVGHLRPSPARPWALRTIAAAMPAAMWATYFAMLGLFSSVGWSPELWAGVTGMSALAGYALSLLVLPPAVPGDEREVATG